MASIRDKQLLGGKTIIKDNLTVYQDEKTGVYSIFIGNNKTHDNILISCKDLDILIHVAKSFDNSSSNNINLNTTNDTSNTVDAKNLNKNTDSCDHVIEGPDGVCIKCGKQLKAGDKYNGGKVIEEIDYNSPQYGGEYYSSSSPTPT